MKQIRPTARSWLKGRTEDDMGIFFLRHRVQFRTALYLGLLGGIVGVLLDVDHIFTYYDEETWGSRWFHWPAFYISCGVVVYYGACAGRLLYKKILRKRDNDG